MLEAILDALLDMARLVPFLFVTYLLMEYLEHRTGRETQVLMQKAGRLGPVIGGALGVVPQCGFSAAASNLYAGRVITLGTLVAIYLSTSDEMLPVMVSAQAPVGLILKILLAKAGIGIFAGLILDFLWRGKNGAGRESHIHEICEQEHCRCEHGIFRSALLHTAKIALFILLIGVVLNVIMYLLGEDALTGLLTDRMIFGPVLAGLVGLIPNCAGSVLLTQLYLQGAIGIGTAIAGLLSGSGVGLLMLFRVNHDRKENFQILGLLYGIGVVAGIVIELWL